MTTDPNDFLDNLDDTITIIRKIDRVYNDKDQVEIYDIAKEILNLNRAVRRKLENNELQRFNCFWRRVINKNHTYNNL